MNLNEERRKYARVSHDSILKCERFTIPPQDEKSTYKTKNISAGGILFESDKKYDLGEILKLEISAQGWDKYLVEFYKPDKLSISEPVKVLGRVVRIEDIGEGRYDIGVEFAAIDEMHRKALARYLGNIRNNEI